MQKTIIIILITLLGINILYVLGGVIYHPLQSMDAIGIWLFKAKAFYIAHGFPNNFLHNPQYSYSHQEYPVGLPFFMFLVYNLIGGINEKVILMVYPIVYFVILILVYLIIRRATNLILALVFTYIYSMFGPFIAGGGRILAGNADIFLVLIEWLILFLLYKKELTYKKYIIITILIMIASQIKLEGAFLSMILLFCPLKLKYKTIFFFISLLPFIIWSSTIHILKIPADTHMIIPSITLSLQRIFFIIIGIVKELININNWYIFWVVLFVALFTNQRLSQQAKQILIPSYITIMILYILVYLFASNDTYTYVTSSFDRVLFQQSAIIFLVFFEKIKAIMLHSQSNPNRFLKSLTKKVVVTKPE